MGLLSLFWKWIELQEYKGLFSPRFFKMFHPNVVKHFVLFQNKIVFCIFKRYEKITIYVYTYIYLSFFN